MVREIRHLKERMGIIYVSIRDDTFTVNKRRVIEFCRKLIDSRLDVMWNCQSRVNAIDEERLRWMRRAGCEHIQYGIESGSERILRHLAKDITIDQIKSACAATRTVGLTLSIYLISGIPGETREDERDTELLLSECRPHDGLVAPLAVFPGTHIYEEMKRSGRIDDEFWIREKKDTLYLMPGTAGRRSFGRKKALCARVGRAAAYTRAELEAHKRLLPDSFATWIASGESFEARGDPGAALREYESIEGFSPGNLWAMVHIGRLLFETGDARSARDYFANALAKAPRSAMLAGLLASCPTGRSRGGRPAGRLARARSKDTARAERRA